MTDGNIGVEFGFGLKDDVVQNIQIENILALNLNQDGNPLI